SKRDWSSDVCSSDLEVDGTVGIRLHVEDRVDEVVDRTIAIRERGLDTAEVEHLIHALQLDVLALVDVHQQAEVQPVDLVRALVVEQVLLSAGNPLVSVRGAVLVAAPVPEVVDPGSTPPIFYAEVPLGVRDSL